MASALDAVLQLKSQEAARQQQQSDNLTQGLSMLQNAMQQARQNKFQELQYSNTLKQQDITNTLDQKQYKAGLAKQGLIEDSSSPSGFKMDSSLQDPLSQLLMKGKAAEAQKNIVEAGGISPNIFGGQSSMPSNSPIGQAISPNQSTLIPDKFNSMGVATSYMNPATEQLKGQIDNQTAITKDQNTRATKLKELNTVIDFFDKKISELPVGSGMQGKLEGMKSDIKGKLGLDAKAAAYNADLQGMRSQIARGLGEVGNLSETEQAAAIKLLPVLSDNNETRQQKLTNFRDYIKTKLGGLNTDQVGGDKKTVTDLPNIFNTIQEAEKANLPDGTPITINGVKGKWKK